MGSGRPPWSATRMDGAAMAEGSAFTQIGLQVRDYVTLGTIVVSSVATIAVMSWRIGAVEHRLDVMDARLWQIWGPRAPTSASGCPADAVRVAIPAMRTEP